MHKTISGLVASICIIGCALARAETVGSVSAVSQPVWIQLDQMRSELDRGNDVRVDDIIVSGSSGRAEVRLWSDVILRLYPDSEVHFRANDGAAEATPELYLQRGRLCLQSGPPTSRGRHFILDVASRLQATIHQSAHVCVLQREDSSKLGLLAGSVQLINKIEPAIVILSEPGFEFHLAEDGSYQLLPPGSGDAIAAIDETPFISEAESETAAGTGTSEQIETTAARPAAGAPPEAPARTAATIDATTTGTASAASDSWIYTVYLFSTRSQEVAREVDQKLQRAGHDTSIIVSTEGDEERYRIAVTGFSTRQAAREYSDSIVGNHGIRDSWIGRDRPAATE